MKKALPPAPLTEEELLPKVIPRHGHTQKDAQKALMKLLQDKKKVDDNIAMTNLAEFGALIKAKGVHATSVGLIMFAANKMREGIERCEKLTESVKDDELKVRLEERISYLATEIGKQGQGMARTEEQKDNPPNNQPNQVIPFPANQVVTNVVVQTTEKP